LEKIMVREVTSEARLAALSPEEAAALWTVRHSEGLTSHEQEQFASWLNRSSENAAAWEDAQAAWDSFDDADDDEILLAMRSHALASQRTSWFRPELAAAAAVALLLLVSAILFLPSPMPNASPSGQQNVPPAVVYASAAGEVKVVTLPDGSRVTLDAASSFETRFSGTSRSARLLRGRAFFDVKSNPQRPFSVAAADRLVMALGTRFDVRLRPDELTVTLVEGSVEISAPGMVGSTVLKPGQQFVEHKGTAVVRSLESSVDTALEWQQGFITFDNDTLADAVAEINRYSSKQLVIQDPSVASLRVTGQFRTGDAERFGRTVAEIHPVRLIRRGPNELELARRG
jgi:transmembrane sensor